MEYYKISYDGYDIKLIAARSRTEAVGFYVLSVRNVFAEELSIEKLPADHEIEIECVGFPVYKIVEELYIEKGYPNCPVLICNLIE